MAGHPIKQRQQTETQAAIILSDVHYCFSPRRRKSQRKLCPQNSLLMIWEILAEQLFSYKELIHSPHFAIALQNLEMSNSDIIRVLLSVQRFFTG
jgi:hypothetical protein